MTSSSDFHSDSDTGCLSVVGSPRVHVFFDLSSARRKNEKFSQRAAAAELLISLRWKLYPDELFAFATFNELVNWKLQCNAHPVTSYERSFEVYLDPAAELESTID